MPDNFNLNINCHFIYTVMTLKIRFVTVFSFLETYLVKTSFLLVEFDVFSNLCMAIITLYNICDNVLRWF